MYKYYCLLIIAFTTLLIVPPTYGKTMINPINASLSIAKDKHNWVIEYKFDKKIKAISFKRGVPRMISENYIINKGMTISMDNIHGRHVRSSNMKLFDYFKIIIKPYYKFITRDYTPNLLYSDGSDAIYTDYFDIGQYAVIDYDNNKRPIMKPVVATYSISSDKNAVVHGKVMNSDEILTSVEMPTYIYIGNSKPEEFIAFTAIIDSQLPTWVNNEITRYSNKILSYYSIKIGKELDKKPFLLIHYTDEKKLISTYDGGALDENVIHLSIRGEKWSKKQEYLRKKLLSLLAHEYVHMWNVYLYQSNNNDHSIWKSEGTADYFSLIALYELGVFSKKELLEKINSTIFKCTSGLENFPLNDAHKHQSSLYYDCGFVINLFIHIAITQKNKSENIFHIWSDLYHQTQGKEYSQSDLLHLLSHKYQHIELAKLIRYITHDKKAKAEIFLNEGLKLLNTSYKLLNNTNNKFYRGTLAKKAFGALMRQDCNGYTDYSIYDDHIETDVSWTKDVCTTFQQTYLINSINDFHLFDEPYKAYKSLYEHCLVSKPVELGLYQSAEKLEVLCTAPIKLIPSWYEIEDLVFLH